MGVATDIITTHKTDAASLRRALGLTGPHSLRTAQNVLNIAWNWHVYGPQGLHPNPAMAKYTREQAERRLPAFIPLCRDLLNQIRADRK